MRKPLYSRYIFTLKRPMHSWVASFFDIALHSRSSNGIWRTAQRRPQKSSKAMKDAPRTFFLGLEVDVESPGEVLPQEMACPALQGPAVLHEGFDRVRLVCSRKPFFYGVYKQCVHVAAAAAAATKQTLLKLSKYQGGRVRGVTFSSSTFHCFGVRATWCIENIYLVL